MKIGIFIYRRELSAIFIAGCNLVFFGIKQGPVVN